MKQIFLLGAASFAALWGQDYIPSGAQIDVRTNESIRVSADDAKGQVYDGVVASEIANPDGRVLIPRGARAELIVRHVGKNEIAIDLASITVGEHRYSVDASEHSVRQREGIGGNKRTGEFVGGGALFGTILGAVAGGGKGAAIGALAGGAAGAGTQLATRGHGVNVPSESLLTFRLEQPLKIDVRDTGYDRDGRHYHNDPDTHHNQ
jgi:hypothetical protein